MNEIAVTAVGADRPGIVAALTRALLELGGNLEDCRAALLRGSFAIALLVSVPDAVGVAEVDAALRPVADELGLGLWTGPAAPDIGPHAAERCMVSVYGIDQPGIVHAITAGARRRGRQYPRSVLARGRYSARSTCWASRSSSRRGSGRTRLRLRLRPVASAHQVELAVVPVTDEVL